MRIVHVVAGLWKDTGGPAEVIPNLCRAQVAAGAKVTLCSIDGDNAPQLEALRVSGVEVQLFEARDSTIRYSPQMRSFLRRHDDFDIVHNHGHWLWPNWAAAAAAKRHNAPLVTSPHGTLVPGMLSRARFKKFMAWTLFDRHIIIQADIIHALSEAELKGMSEKIGEAARRAVVIPNGIHVPALAGERAAGGGGTLLFLSRVSPVKGILQLLIAWRAIAPDFPSWRLKIVGPVDGEIYANVAHLVRESDRVDLVGPVYHEDRWVHYQNASAFILPTLGEGLPTVLLEAAAHRLPIITTPEANFDELHNAGGSILTSSDPAELKKTLQSFFSMTPEARKAIGRKGEKLVRNHYNWESVARNWLEVYERIAGGQKGANSK